MVKYSIRFIIIGDFSPRTVIGRYIIVFIAASGAVSVSILMVVLTVNLIELKSLLEYFLIR